jgi:hypothetical protein
LPGLRIEEILQEKLVLVTTGDDQLPKGTDYVYVDWGPRFLARHDMNFPDLAHPGMYVSLGPLGLSYILNCGGSGYFRMRTAAPYLRAGRIRLVRGAPEYAYPVHAVYPIDGDPDLLDPGLEALRSVAASESDEWPIETSPENAGDRRSNQRSRAQPVKASDVGRGAAVRRRTRKRRMRL